MIPKIKKASYAGNFTIHVVFTDGAEGDVDLKAELYGDIFEELKDQSYFSKVFVHPEFHTLCWPNGTDIAPEFLYDKLQTFA
jgi:hypothetical protein